MKYYGCLFMCEIFVRWSQNVIKIISDLYTYFSYFICLEYLEFKECWVILFNKITSCLIVLSRHTHIKPILYSRGVKIFFLLESQKTNICALFVRHRFSVVATQIFSWNHRWVKYLKLYRPWNLNFISFLCHEMVFFLLSSITKNLF